MGALAAVLSLTSCKKESPEQPLQTKSEFEVDSVVVNDTTQIGSLLKLGFSNTILVFPSIKDKVLQDSIYSFYKEVRQFHL